MMTMNVYFGLQATGFAAVPFQVLATNASIYIKFIKCCLGYKLTGKEIILSS